MKLGLIVVAAMALSLALPVGAWACNNPGAQRDGGDPPGGTGPGEPVYFVIYNIGDGAEWNITHDGQPVDEGSGTFRGSGSEYHGTVPMPNLGTRSREVYLDLKVTHLGHEEGAGPWYPSVKVQYRGTSPSTSPSPQTIDQPVTPQPQSAPQQVKAPSGTQPLGVGGSPPAGGTGGLPPSGPAGAGGGSGAPSAPGGPSGGPVDVAGADAALATEQSKGVRAGRARAPAARTALPERATDFARRPPVRVAAAARADGADGSGRVILVLVAFTAAGLAGAMALRRRRGGSGQAAGADGPLVPSDPAVEAELQEIISEERAKLDRDERPPAELAAARDDPG